MSIIDTTPTSLTPTGPSHPTSSPTSERSERADTPTGKRPHLFAVNINTPSPKPNSAPSRLAHPHSKRSRPSARGGRSSSDMEAYLQQNNLRAGAKAWPSKKMGVIIQFESHRCELPAILPHLERGHEILEFCAQPSPSNASSERGTL